METPMKDMREQLRTEMLEAELERAEIKRAYVADGIEATWAMRAALDARIARLTLELHKYNVAEYAEKKRVKSIHRMQTFSILIDKLESNGLGKFVNEARAESLTQLEAAGLREAYEA
jgi:hypothetical protein